MARTAVSKETPGLPQPRRAQAMFVIVLGLALAVLDSTLMNLALPDIARDVGAQAAHSIWVVNGYQMAVLVLLLPLASFGDLLGYRRIYLGGTALFTAASLVAMLADSLPSLVAARVVQGLGAAGIMSVNAALVRLIYPPDLLGRGVAINSLTVAAASVAGPSVAAAILSIGPWPWLFAVNLPLGLLTLWLGRRVLPANAPAARPGKRFNALDVLLNVLMFALVFAGADALGVRSGNGQGAPLLGWLMLGAGVLVGVFYLRRQTALALPLFPVDLMRIPVFALSMASSVSAFCAQMLAYVALPFLLLDGLGRSHAQAGLLITAWPLAIVVTAPLVGRYIGRWPDGLFGGVGMVLMAAGLALLAMLPAQPGDIAIAWRMALCGVGFALFQSPNNHAIVTTPPPHRSGAASGMLGTARLTGQTLGAMLVAIVFSIWNPHDGRGPLVALGLAAGSALLAAVFSSARMPANKRRVSA
ncbi:MFS transporter [Xylophilus sp.]|uniref:MFS transporter n=1 Tax=Xylophilus sp. TaxID=2653893 RepID=UPI0013B74E69|nr:MFS transporter [Xylophilus sp.]KAF1048736.1 MAG: Riboflavin transporter RibZ [Xylophilus sp.]